MATTGTWTVPQDCQSAVPLVTKPSFFFYLQALVWLVRHKIKFLQHRATTTLNFLDGNSTDSVFVILSLQSDCLALPQLHQMHKNLPEPLATVPKVKQHN